MSFEQLEESKARFSGLTPRLHRDARFMVQWLVSAKGVYVPMVSLSEYAGDEILSRYISVIKVRQDKFRLVCVGFFILVGVGIPAKYWPHDVTSAELDETIIKMLEAWIAIRTHVSEQLKRLRGPDEADALPL